MHYLYTTLAQLVDISPLPDTKAGPDTIQTVLSITFGIIGAISLLVITIGGFRYIVSEGDPQATARAKSTIIYALVGLLISISAVTIVTFTLGKV